MDNCKLLETYTFPIDVYSTDYHGRFNLSALVNCLLEAATRHAESRGFGYEQLNAAGKAWVLSRLVIELEHIPIANQELQIETWVSEVNKLFTMRNFALSIDDKPIGYAKSIWAAIDTTTRRPTNLLELNNGLINYVCSKECPVQRSSGMKGAGGEAIHKHLVRYSDLDINQHVNSAKYVAHILDLFSDKLLTGKTIKRFEIAYMNEAHYGDILSFYCEEKTEGAYLVDLRKESGETVVRSIVTMDY